MQKKTAGLILFLAVLLSVTSCQKHKQFKEDEVILIPQPQKVELGTSSFTFSKKTTFICDKEFAPIAQQLIAKFKVAGNFTPTIKNTGETTKNSVVFQLNKQLQNEAYTLSVSEEQIIVEAAKYAGFFNAVQTIRQLLPEQIESTTYAKNVDWWIPTIQISDNPRFKWRGFMQDVSRHFMPKKYILSLIDYLSLHKINKLHLHLVDDQGWRIEIKKYPKLTEVGAWRVDHEDKAWDGRPKQKPGEKATYGGFYTQDDLKEMIAYAQARNITIIPEIEMPAHTTCSLAAYPEYSCSGGPFTVPTGGLWPITDIYCAGNDATFTFLEDILTEVMALFPSQYIHIGGDEATKTEWEKCPKCRKRVRTEKLKNVEELQSYFIKRIEKFINSKGRTLIGWDEILEGGLAPQATVMSWRGYKGGIEAAEQGHDVVMTPGSPCYFDHYQGAMDQEPEAWGGFNPISKVYQFDPVHKSMSAEAAKHVLGGQANLWTEKVPGPKHAMYMSFPRIAALAEAVWTEKANKDWNRFSTNIRKFLQRYDIMGISYARSAFNVTAKTKLNIEKKQLAVSLTSELGDDPIHYTVDGSTPTEQSPRYSAPIILKKPTTIKAATFANGKQMGKVLTQNFNIHKATVKPVEQKIAVSPKYKGQGALTLVNSIRGSKNLADGEWQAWSGKNMEAIVDLQHKLKVNKVTVGALQSAGSWVFLPTKVTIMASTDGMLYQKLGTVKHDVAPLAKGIIINDFVLDQINKEIRYLKVIAHNMGKCPKDHNGAGSDAWIFLDEIIVE
ncbi:beta-N-acetylhexosaminidase [Prolixibacteraceae bacterium JC049]|nr:beta-N-acetylhexosaminidase [Prolixibacteraceae bacterium JC049]